eukprot:362866-Chlamydomonas_euryale.AAC.43
MSADHPNHTAYLCMLCTGILRRLALWAVGTSPRVRSFPCSCLPMKVAIMARLAVRATASSSVAASVACSCHS